MSGVSLPTQAAGAVPPAAQAEALMALADQAAGAAQPANKRKAGGELPRSPSSAKKAKPAEDGKSQDPVSQAAVRSLSVPRAFAPFSSSSRAVSASYSSSSNADARVPAVAVSSGIARPARPPLTEENIVLSMKNRIRILREVISFTALEENFYETCDYYIDNWTVFNSTSRGLLAIAAELYAERLFNKLLAHPKLKNPPYEISRTERSKIMKFEAALNNISSQSMSGNPESERFEHISSILRRTCAILTINNLDQAANRRMLQFTIGKSFQEDLPHFRGFLNSNRSFHFLNGQNQIVKLASDIIVLSGMRLRPYSDQAPAAAAASDLSARTVHVTRAQISEVPEDLRNSSNPPEESPTLTPTPPPPPPQEPPPQLPTFVATLSEAAPPTVSSSQAAPQFRAPLVSSQMDQVGSNRSATLSMRPPQTVSSLPSNSNTGAVFRPLMHTVIPSDLSSSAPLTHPSAAPVYPSSLSSMGVDHPQRVQYDMPPSASRAFHPSQCLHGFPMTGSSLSAAPSHPAPTHLSQGSLLHTMAPVHVSQPRYEPHAQLPLHYIMPPARQYGNNAAAPLQDDVQLGYYVRADGTIVVRMPALPPSSAALPPTNVNQVRLNAAAYQYLQYQQQLQNQQLLQQQQQQYLQQLQSQYR